MNPTNRNSRLLLLSVLAAAALSTAAEAKTHEIDFDEATLHGKISKQYPGVTFSSEPGYEMAVRLVGSNPKIAPRKIGTTSDFDLGRNLVLDFDPPVDFLSFTDTVEKSGSYVVTIEFGTSTATLHLVGYAGSHGLISLTQFPDVKRVVLDTNGIEASYDSFRFDSTVAYTRTYGAGVPGALGHPPLLHPLSPPVVGTSVAIDCISSVPVQTVGLLIAGKKEASIPALGGTVLASIDVVEMVPIFPPEWSVPNTFVKPIPSSVPFLDQSIYTQMIVADPVGPAGFAFSQGLELHFGE